MGRVHRPDPVLLDLGQRDAHPHLVDLAVGRETADQDRDVELPPLGIGDVGEQERLAVLGVDPATELPAHQRVHLGVLVDPPVDLDQQAGFAQRRDMLVEIAVAPRRRRHGRWTPSAAPAGAREIVGPVAKRSAIYAPAPTVTTGRRVLRGGGAGRILGLQFETIRRPGRTRSRRCRSNAQPRPWRP